MSQKNKKIVIGNWKMNPKMSKEAEKVYSGIHKKFPKLRSVDVAIAPPFIFIDKLKKISKKIILGAQNCSMEEAGAYTGEISTFMLASLGVKYVILGHSERRDDTLGSGETSLFVSKKVKMALAHFLIPVLCVGEAVRDEEHQYLNFIKQELLESLEGVPKSLINKVIVAYEPIWAIGKSALREATPEEFREMSIFIRKVLSDKFGAESASDVRIIYGGSVNPKNAESFIREGGADGFLVGRDSLDPEKFVKIIELCEASKN